MTFLNWSPCLLIRFTSLYYILTNGCVYVSSFEQSRSWARLSGELAREGGSKNIFYYSYVLVEKSDATVFLPPYVFHNSTKGRLSFSYISLQSTHSPTRLHATEGKRFEIPFVYTLESLLQIES